MAKPNEKYEIKSNSSKYIEEGYLKRKEVVENLNGYRSFTRKEFFSEMAEYCGVKMSTVSQIHTRNLTTSYLVSIKIAEFLNVPVTKIWEVVEIENN